MSLKVRILEASVGFGFFRLLFLGGSESALFSYIVT